MWPNSQYPADLGAFTEDILMANFIFCAVYITFFNFSLLTSHYVTITEKLELCLLTVLLILKD